MDALPPERSQDQQQEQLINNLFSLVDHHRAEWDVSDVAIIGALEVVKADLLSHLLTSTIDQP
jgi:hypothetical protein